MQSELRCMQVDAVTLEKSLREPWLKVPNINRSLVTNVDSQPPLCASHLGVQNDMFNLAFVSRLRWGWWGGLLITCEGQSKERHVWLWEANLFNVGAIGTEHGVSGLQGELSRSCDYLRSDLERCGRCLSGMCWRGLSEWQWLWTCRTGRLCLPQEEVGSYLAVSCNFRSGIVVDLYQ